MRNVSTFGLAILLGFPLLAMDLTKFHFENLNRSVKFFETTAIISKKEDGASSCFYEVRDIYKNEGKSHKIGDSPLTHVVTFSCWNGENYEAALTNDKKILFFVDEEPLELKD